MTLAERELNRILAQVQSTVESQAEAKKQAWRNRCRSDRPMHLASDDKTTRKLSCVMPSGIPMSRVLGEMPKRGIHATKGDYRGGFRLQNGYRNLVVVRRSELIASGLPEELARQIIQAQARKIVTKFIGPRETIERAEKRG